MKIFKRAVIDNIKHYKANSIFVKTFTLALVFLLVPFILVSVFYYNSTKSNMDSIIKNENDYTIDTIANITDTIIGECDMVSTYISNSDDVQLFMLNSDFISMRQNSLRYIGELENGLALIYDYVDSIYIYSELNNQIINGDKLSSVDKFNDKAWLSYYGELGSPKGIVVARAKKGTYPYLISIIKPIIIDKEKKGAIVFNINSQELFGVVATQTNIDNLLVYILGSNNQILGARKADSFGKYINEIFPNFDIENVENISLRSVEGERYMLYGIEPNGYGVSYIGAYSMDVYEAKMRSVVMQITILLTILILLSIAFAFVISSLLYRPVDEILSVIKTMDIDSDRTPFQNETKYIVSNILRNIEANEQMKAELEHRLELLNQSQVAMLQVQINPHFLYNTLDAINMMSVEENGVGNDISKAILSLSRMMRGSIDSKEYIISIAQEIEYTNNYMRILDLRYGDMFDTTWDIQEYVYGYSIIKICLQPIIENAVYHGLKPLGTKGELKIMGNVNENDITFIVSDNGVGMSEERIAEINTQLESKELFFDEHIGLSNVNHRIKLIYGDDYGVKVSGAIDNGTTVTIKLPKIKFVE